jgi:hypothetical protein
VIGQRPVVGHAEKTVSFLLEAGRRQVAQ